MLALDTKSLSEFALAKIDEAKIVEQPFPHIIIDQFFPDAFFQDLINNFPDRSQFQEWHTRGQDTARKRLVITRADLRTKTWQAMNIFAM